MISKRALTTLPIVMAFASVIAGSGPQNALAMCVRPDSFEAMVAGGPHSASTKFYDSIFIARVTGIRSDIQAGSPSSKTMMYEPATYDAVDMQLQERLLGSIPEHPTVMSRQGWRTASSASPERRMSSPATATWTAPSLPPAACRRRSTQRALVCSKASQIPGRFTPRRMRSSVPSPPTIRWRLRCLACCSSACLPLRFSSAPELAGERPAQAFIDLTRRATLFRMSRASAAAPVRTFVRRRSASRPAIG
jgi:hypothetical protein